ncbi:MAG: type II toxin-antitoxin system VapC family toxin [Gammaproteobacteria bacterium]|jgi:PIN domain nuclease of toxin-antitoxin system|nr:type II toxin-antitoxin system VapC family toxin [Gammaproteobacteria bacterium]
MTLVLDASALLAWLHREPGGERVGTVLDGASISAVNWSEVIQKSLRKGVEVQGMLEEVTDLGLTVEPFTPAQAEQAARLWAQTRGLGLSLGDRACLALALDRSAPVLTADRDWGSLALGVEVQLLR